MIVRRSDRFILYFNEADCWWMARCGVDIHGHGRQPCRTAP